MSESALHRSASAVGVLPIAASPGQLLVYEYCWPGRSAAAAQAVQAKKAVSWRSSPGR